MKAFRCVLLFICVQLALALAPIPLASPQNISLKAVSGHFKLSWDASSGAKAYELRILRVSGSVCKELKVVSTPNNFLYLDEHLTPPANYLIHIRSKNALATSHFASSGYIPYGLVGSPLDKGQWVVSVSPKTHRGSDFYALDYNLTDNTDRGKAVYAVANGVIKMFHPSNGQIILEHSTPLATKTGKLYPKWYSTYAHMDPVFFEKGQVQQGQIIGRISDKGIKYGLATGAHLHFSISQDLYSKLDSAAISPQTLYFAP